MLLDHYGQVPSYTIWSENKSLAIETLMILYSYIKIQQEKNKWGGEYSIRQVQVAAIFLLLLIF